MNPKTEGRQIGFLYFLFIGGYHILESIAKASRMDGSGMGEISLKQTQS